MELTTLDKELLDGLQVLTDGEVSRVQAHLAAGLPMQIFWGYEGEEEPACFGCLVGTAMSRREARSRRLYGGENDGLAQWTFPNWVRAQYESYTVADSINELVAMQNGYPRALSKNILDRLAAILDMEWTRRHPLPADIHSECEEPANREYAETGKALATNRQEVKVG